jgi:hypothetical protein
VHHSLGRNRHRIKCWIINQVILSIQNQNTEQEKQRIEKIGGGDLWLLSGGNMVIGSILPASVLNSFRRGSSVSSSQQSVPRSSGKKKARENKKNRTKKIFRIENKRDPKKEIGWLGSAGKSAYRSISYTERPVIWSVELEYYRVVTAISLHLRRTD